MRKMFSKRQIETIIQEAINSGVIESPLLIQGTFTDSNDEDFTIISELNPYSNEGKYYCRCVGVAGYFEIHVDFENQEIADIGGDEIELNGANIRLIKILNGEVVAEIDE